MDGSPNVDLVDDDDDEDNPSVVGAMMAETDHPIIRINAQLDQLDIHRRSYINMVWLICFLHKVYCKSVAVIRLDQLNIQRRSYINMVSLICFLHIVYCKNVAVIHLAN